MDGKDTSYQIVFVYVETLSGFSYGLHREPLYPQGDIYKYPANRWRIRLIEGNEKSLHRKVAWKKA